MTDDIVQVFIRGSESADVGKFNSVRVQLRSLWVWANEVRFELGLKVEVSKVTESRKSDSLWRGNSLFYRLFACLISTVFLRHSSSRKYFLTPQPPFSLIPG